MPNKTLTIFIISIIIIALAGMAYYWLYVQSNPLNLLDDTETAPTTFVPINRPGANPTRPAGTSTSTQPTSNIPAPVVAKLPQLRQLSTEPVGGFMASSTASSTVVRYFDRATGYVYQANSNKDTVEKISNTTLPRIYESYWNKNLSVAILRYIKDDEGEIISNFYGEIRQVKTSTSSPQSTTPFEIKGKFLSSNINQIAVSPKGDRVFTLNIEGDAGVGYISGFDENKKTKVFDSPLTQLNVAWPEENTIAIGTKPSIASLGYLYLLDIKKVTTKMIVGGIRGLATKVSADAKKILISSGNQDKISTSIYTIKDGSTQDMVFRTLAEKCVWSKIHADEAYCAVPSEIPNGIYPDDWYKGNVSFVDQIWHVNAVSGEVSLIANLLNLGDALIDATNLTLDPKENYLYFVNKRDLTLWSLGLN